LLLKLKSNAAHLKLVVCHGSKESPKQQTSPIAC
jgi:hypothetical protein